MEKIFIKNSFGEKLAGMFNKSEKSYKLVIICHGRACTKDEHFYPELALELSRNWFNTFRFDFSGNGESEGKFEDSTITKEIEDIKSVVNYFRNKFEIFCIVGHSQGAVEALLHQAKYGTARCVVSIGAYADQRDATTRKFQKEKIDSLNKEGFITLNAWGKTFRLTKKYFYDRAGYGDITDEVRKIKSPILALHGTNDKDVDFANGLKIKAVINKKSKFIEIEEADHFFTNINHKSELINEIVKWLKKQK